MGQFERESWQQTLKRIRIEEEVFARVIESGDSPESRQACLDEECGQDLDLRRRIEKLIREYECPDEIFADPAISGDQLVAAATPRQLGDFEVIGELGRGGMGVVYEASQRSLNRTVALKVLSTSLRLSAVAAARFQREAEAAARLHHTNIVQVHTTGTENDVPYYVMELIRGPSLDRVIARRRHDQNILQEFDSTVCKGFESTSATGDDELSSVELWTGDETANWFDFGEGQTYFETVARLMAEVADGLSHGHQHGVVHRDIKPANLLLTPDGKLAINDFGLARLLEEPGVTTTGELLGTPVYMSPELVSVGQNKVDRRTDIYSFGATLYELLTLKPPFQGDGRDHILLQVVQAAPTAPRTHDASIPRDLETICLKAMEKDPAHRYQTAADLAEDLRRFVSGHTISARRVQPLTKLARWSRRNRLAASLTVLLLCSIVLVVAIPAWLTHKSRVEVEQRSRANYSAFRNRVKALLARNHPFEALEMILESKQFGERVKQEAFYNDLGGATEITSEPSGAEVFVRPARGNSKKWLSLGKTPVQVPIEFEPRLHWKTTLPGFDNNYRLTCVRWAQYRNQIRLSQVAGMVPIPPTSHTPGSNDCRIAWMAARQLPQLSEFYIDRYEVTNAEFAAFVAAGGYQREEYWRVTLGENWRSIIKEAFRDKTGQLAPQFWVDGKYRPGEANHPVVGVSWYEARAYAHWKGKQLPTVFHWLHATRFRGFFADVELLRHSNIGKKHEYPWASQGQDDHLSVNGLGVVDLFGNVKEWCMNEDADGKYYALGGGFGDDFDRAYMPESFKALLRHEDVGFRCADYIPTDAAAAAAPVRYASTKVAEKLDISRYRPKLEFDRSRPFEPSNLTNVELSGPQIPPWHWRYDPILEWQPVAHDEIKDRLQLDIQRFEISGPDGDRIPVYVAWPDSGRFKPPYPPVVMCNDLGRARESPLKCLFRENEQELLESGRVLVLPIYWGTFDRRHNDLPGCFPVPNREAEFVSSMFRLNKDFSRVVDFLVEQGGEHALQQAIDPELLAYFGQDKGAAWGPMLLVADELSAGEKRFRSSVLVHCGWIPAEYPVEVDQRTYVPYLDTPTLMLNFANDIWFSHQSMYDALPGVHRDTKRHEVLPGRVIGRVPRATFRRYATSWLDRWQKAEH